MKRLLTGAMIVALVCSVIANVMMYLRYSAGRPLLTMDSTVITRKEYRDALDSQYGKPVLRKMVLARLVEREARKEGLLPTTEEVQARLKDLERDAPTVVQRAKQDEASLYNLQQDTRTDISLERLRIRGITVSDAEIAEYYQQNPNRFRRPMQVETTAVMTANANDAKIAAELLRQNMKPFMIAHQPRLHVFGVGGFQPDLSKLSRDEITHLQNTMAGMQAGEVAIVPLKDNYVIFRMIGQQKMETMPLSSAKQEAARLAKLAKAPSPEDVLLRLYQDAHPVFEANQYAEYFREFEEARNSPVKAGTLKPTTVKQTASR